MVRDCYTIAPDVDADDGPHPLVVAIHGGPVSYDEPEFRFDHSVFTSRGYLVLRPNYRGGTSYGGIAQGYLVTQTDLLAAAAPEHGIYDLRSAFGTDDIADPDRAIHRLETILDWYERHDPAVEDGGAV